MSRRWSEGDSALCDAFDAWAAGSMPRARVLAESPRRRVMVWRSDAFGHCVVKEFRAGSREGFGLARLAAAPFRGLQTLARRTAADREWRAMKRLHALGVAVPEPLARAQSRFRGALLVIRHIDARVLDRALETNPARRRAIMVEVGRLVSRLHAAGFVHRDLHVGNILIGTDGPVLIDLQRAAPSRSDAARLRDLGDLDFSLHHRGVSIADRMRFRRAALGVEGAQPAAAHARLRAIGAAAEARAHAYARGRMRRCTRRGPEWSDFEFEGAKGLRASSFAQKSAHEALAAHRRASADRSPDLLKSDHRSTVSAVDADGRAVVVKEVVKGRPRRWLADRFRGSPARRTWIACHGLAAYGIATAKPLAFVEDRRFGVPIASLVIVEDLRPALPIAADPPRPRDRTPPEPLAELLRRLLTKLHRAGIDHGDLQALHVFVREQGGERFAALIDLDGVRFRRTLSDDRRIQSLAELNASIEEARLPTRLRREAFERYARALPFRSGSGKALHEVVRRSLARGHAWRGDRCDGATSTPSR